MTTKLSLLSIFGVWSAFVTAAWGQNQIIPPPGPAQSSGYYLQLSDDRVVDAAALTHQSVSTPSVMARPSQGETSYAPVPTSPTAAGPPMTTGQIRSSPTPWQAPAALDGVQPAGCNDCGQLWAGACSEPRGRGVPTGRLFGLGGPEACDMPVNCDLPGSACAGLCGNQGGCGGGCGMWTHCTSLSVGYLYLRPRNADVAYAVPIDGPISQAPANNPVQIGGVGVVDPDYESGFSGRLNLAINSMTSLVGEVTVLDAATRDQIATSAPNVLRSIVSHPSTSSIATDFLSGSANLDLDLETFDFGIRHLFVGGNAFAINYFLGSRYGHLDQRFNATFLANGTESVQTDIDFDGVGPRLGLEAEKRSCRSRLRMYAKASASFLAGRFRANYFQGGSFDPAVVDTDWEAGRIVPVLDVELGSGWSSYNDRFHLRVGYLVSSWFNTVKTEDFIRSVQRNDFIDLHDTITFDGLRLQAEWRF